MYRKPSNDAAIFYNRKSKAIDLGPLNQTYKEGYKSKSPLMPNRRKSPNDDLPNLPVFSKIFFFLTMSKDTNDIDIEKKDFGLSGKELEWNKSVVLDTAEEIEDLSAIPANKERSGSHVSSLNNSFKNTSRLSVAIKKVSTEYEKEQLKTSNEP